jgi:mannose-1-phosphate guanylyltransferase
MKAFIFTAGYGERLRPLTDRMPKPLAPVVNVPALCWPLAVLAGAGVSDVTCNLHHRHEELVSFFNGNGNFDFDITYSFEETILGTGGGLKKCEKLLSAEDFVVLNGDVIMDLDVARLMELHRERGAIATVVLYRHRDAGSIGPVALRDGAVADFKNFLGSGLGAEHIYTGAAALSPEIFRYLEPDFSSIVYTAYVEIIRSRRLEFFVHDGYWHDIGSPESLYRVNMEMLDRIGGIGKLMAPLAGIEAAAVSSTASIGRGALVERSVVGEGAFVGTGAVVRDSVLLPGACVEQGVILDGSLIFGDRVIN